MGSGSAASGPPVTVPGDPYELERFYRENPRAARAAILAAHARDPENQLLAAWHARLTYGEEREREPSRSFVLEVAIALAAFAVLRLTLGWPPGAEDTSVFVNWPLVVMAAVAAGLAVRSRRPLRYLAAPAVVFAILASYLNALPGLLESDTGLLAALHGDFLAWTAVGLVSVGALWRAKDAWVRYFRFSGEFVVACGVLGLAAPIYAGVLYGLFTLIRLDVSRALAEWLAPAGAAVLPLVAVRMAERMAASRRPLADWVAAVFAPVALATIVAFFVGVVATGHSPFVERDFLAVFAAVAALSLLVVVFILAARDTLDRLPSWLAWVVAGLALAAAVFDGTALVAVAWRLQSFGFTPNRTALLGMNVLLLVNLGALAVPLARIASRRGLAAGEGDALLAVARTVSARLLPAYCGWAAVVSFLFPVVFGFR